MKTKEEAIELSKIMKQIGTLVGKDTICIITSMEEKYFREWVDYKRKVLLYQTLSILSTEKKGWL